jgi:hypothetical protein
LGQKAARIKKGSRRTQVRCPSDSTSAHRGSIEGSWLGRPFCCLQIGGHRFLISLPYGFLADPSIGSVCVGRTLCRPGDRNRACATPLEKRVSAFALFDIVATRPEVWVGRNDSRLQPTAADVSGMAPRGARICVWRCVQGRLQQGRNDLTLAREIIRDKGNWVLARCRVFPHFGDFRLRGLHGQLDAGDGR